MYRPLTFWGAIKSLRVPEVFSSAFCSWKKQTRHKVMQTYIRPTTNYYINIFFICPTKLWYRREFSIQLGPLVLLVSFSPPSSSSPWRLERMWSTHHVTRQCLRSAVLRCKELLEHFPEQLPALLEALHLSSQVPCDSSGWWANQNPPFFVGALDIFLEALVASEVSGILNKFWRLNRSKAPTIQQKVFLLVLLLLNWLVVSNIFYFHPYLRKWSNSTNIFQMGWNHQLVKCLFLKTLHHLDGTLKKGCR